jgi:hypothetical protein
MQQIETPTSGLILDRRATRQFVFREQLKTNRKSRGKFE